MKFLVSCLIALMLAGAAVAQDVYGPEYKKATNTANVGTKININPNKTSGVPTSKPLIYLVSDEDGFLVSGYTINPDGTATKVFPLFSAADADSAVHWVANVPLPVKQEIDVLIVDSDAYGGSVDVLIYR